MKNTVNPSLPAFRRPIPGLVFRPNVIQRWHFVCFVLVGSALIAGLLFLKAKSWGIMRRPTEKALVMSTIPDKLTFRMIAVSDGNTEDGYRFSQRHYKSSDCKSLLTTVVFFKSPDRAYNEVATEASRATKIIDRKPVFDISSQLVIGEKILLELAEGQGQTHAKLAWNERSEYSSIVAPSAYYVLEFEKSAHLTDKKAFPGIDSVRDVKFQSVGSTEGLTLDGIPYKEERFNSSDCETVTTRTQFFESAEKAQEEVRRRLADATDILEKGNKLNSAGEVVGQRAVASFPSDPSATHVELTTIMWTDGAILHSVQGPYIYAMEFESRLDGNRDVHVVKPQL